MFNIDSYKRQEIALILLNIAVLAALFVVHIVFLFEIGRPSKFLLMTLAARFILLLLELVWLQKMTAEIDPRIITVHSHISIWLNILFAFVASIFGGTPDSHYSVLMVIPIIQAAYRFNLAKTIGIVMVTIILTLVEVWTYFQQKPPIDYGEFFEAATVSLIFFVVGVIVWLLVGSLREEEAKLQESLEKLKKAQAKLVAEEKFAAIGQLSSAIAHEIRNPVAMIASSLEMASSQGENSPVRAEMFEIATQEASRLALLTDDFLSYARMKAPEIRTTSVADTIEYVASLSKARLAENEIRLEVFCPENLEAEFDGGQIRRALLNLVLNAADATLSKGIVKIGCLNEGQFLRVFVENNGRAIPAESVSQLFEPFFTTKANGTGLGLSIVRNIARAHGGEITLENNENGRVRFTMELPKNGSGAR